MIRVTIAGKSFEIELNGFPLGVADFLARVNDQEFPVCLPSIDFHSVDADEYGYTLYLIVDGRPYEINLDRDFRWIGSDKGIFFVDLRDKETSPNLVLGGDGRLKAPIPGLVTKVMVSVGDEVELGQPLLVLEAMKMENEIRAPQPGRIKTLLVQPGISVSQNELLAEIIE